MSKVAQKNLILVIISIVGTLGSSLQNCGIHLYDTKRTIDNVSRQSGQVFDQQDEQILTANGLSFCVYTCTPVKAKKLNNLLLFFPFFSLAQEEHFFFFSSLSPPKTLVSNSFLFQV